MLFKIFPSKYIWATILTFQGNVVSHVTIWYPIGCSIVTESVSSPAILDIMGSKHIGVMTSAFQYRVTSLVHSLALIVFEIFASKYLGHNLDLSWSCDITGPVTISYPGAISYRCSTVPESVSPAIFKIMGHKHIGVTTLIGLENPCAYTETHAQTNDASDFIFCPMQRIALDRQ